MSPYALSLYLQDHFAGAAAGVALARRVAESNAGTAAGPALSEVADEVAEDRDSLARLMAELDVRPSRMKAAAALLTERVARAKPNGRRRIGTRYHRLHELEALSLGIAGKLGLWEALRLSPEAAGHADLDALEERARRQRARVEEVRVASASRAFADPD